MLPGSRNVRHVFIQDVLLCADAVILYVFRPVQLTHVKVKGLRGQEREGCLKVPKRPGTSIKFQVLTLDGAKVHGHSFL